MVKKMCRCMIVIGTLILDALTCLGADEVSAVFS